MASSTAQRAVAGVTVGAFRVAEAKVRQLGVP